jgi:hypothetical protein
LLGGGCCASDLRIAGFTGTQLKDAGCSCRQLKDAGFSALQSREASFNLADLDAAGYGFEDLKLMYGYAELAQVHACFRRDTVFDRNSFLTLFWLFTSAYVYLAD